jgi:hypothetical protein
MIGPSGPLGLTIGSNGEMIGARGPPPPTIGSNGEMIGARGPPPLGPEPVSGASREVVFWTT